MHRAKSLLAVSGVLLKSAYVIAHDNFAAVGVLRTFGEAIQRWACDASALQR